MKGTLVVIGQARDWHELTSFRLDDRIYVLASVVPTGALMRYTLAPAPPGHLIRTLVELG